MRARIVNRAVVSCLAAVAGSSGLGVSAASADSVLGPTNDTWVASAAPAANFASDSVLGVTGTPASRPCCASPRRPQASREPSSASMRPPHPPMRSACAAVLRIDDQHGQLEHATRARCGDRQQVVGVGWMERHRASGHGREQRRRDLPAGNEAQRCGRTIPRRAQHAPVGTRPDRGARPARTNSAAPARHRRGRHAALERRHLHDRPDRL